MFHCSTSSTAYLQEQVQPPHCFSHIRKDDDIIMGIPCWQEAPGEQKIPAGAWAIGKEELLSFLDVSQGNGHRVQLICRLSSQPE